MNERAREIAERALRHDTETRSGFLDRACGDDADLRTAVETMLTEWTRTLGAATSDPAAKLQPGRRLGRYEILEPIGAGGMGEVYKAADLRLGRVVAIKVLPGGLSGSAERRERFEREARVISRLNHPNICTLYDVGHHEGIDFLVMEYLEGSTLSARLAEGALPLEQSLSLARQIADGLDCAHEAGVVHRDLKPANVMLTESGVKLLDFGLAKQIDVQSAKRRAGAPLDDRSGDAEMTRVGAVLGTVPYMSPEQAAGRPVDALSDQFSFGTLFYEMLCGTRPFDGDSAVEILSGIRESTPPPVNELRPDLPTPISRIVRRCLEKDPRRRFETTRLLSDAIRRCEERLAGRRLPGPRTLAAIVFALVLIGGGVAWTFLRNDAVRWLERERLEEIDRLTDSGDVAAAFPLIHEIHRKIPSDPEVGRRLKRITLAVSIATEPPGAAVRVRPYASDAGDWVELGETPLEDVRVPYAVMEWEIEKQGFETFRGAPFGVRPFTVFAAGFPLEPVGSRPEGTVRVPGGPYRRLGFPPVSLSDYWIDRYEVTNDRYRAFVEAGGYERDEWWNDPFVEESGTVARADALARFVDATGRRGPASWRNGTFEAGREEFPVGGVSWFEASAYCRFVGKRLPTIYHWSAATAQDQFADIIAVSNFGSEGPAAVGSHPGLGDFGTYDMAGNVREWCSNDSDMGRYILGGAWNSPTYTFRIDAEIVPPWDRSAANGFRCAVYDDAGDEIVGTITSDFRVRDLQPVDDAIFDVYRSLYAYDRKPLEPEVIAVDESSPDWRRETVSFDAAYGNERVVAHVFLPRDVAPPYAPVIWFPGNDVFFADDENSLVSPYLYDFLPRHGRALIYPVYKGTYQRHIPFSFAPNEWRDMIVWWSKDVSRTVDYLEERDDIDTARLAYYGFSSGALYAPVFTAIDDRFRAAILLAGGIFGGLAPEADAVNFAPHSEVPTLMINGKDDLINPVEYSQRPLFDLLGAAEDRKRLVHLDGGHIVQDREALIDEVLAWLDRWAGPRVSTGIVSEGALASRNAEHPDQGR